MRIAICTTPIRPVPTDYPPFGPLAVIQSLRTGGYDPYFYDIDGLRPTFDQVLEFFKDYQPTIIGISAAVSTAYAYTKKLALALRDIFPATTIIVGGNLAASAEILHRLCKVDFCVIGEGERVVVNLVKYLESCGGSHDDSLLRQIKGITYLDKNGEMTFTGYEEPVTAEELFDPDFSILEKHSRIELFIRDPLTRGDFYQDPRTYEPHRIGKKLATVISAKGCVARCTFCHRWDRGYRHLPPQKIISRIKYLMERYNVGFIQFGDENFGSDRSKLEELIELIQPLDILYEVSGVRCRSVDPALLKKLRESGCVSLYYGMETGSPKILQVMEKKTSLEQNINAARWTHEAGLYTIYQLVLGMPGETPETISETIEFLKSATEFLPEPPTGRLSINYIQALPGTPVYEYARTKGLIGGTMEDEERYLLTVSDVNARDDTKFLNFTPYDYLTVQTWRRRILFETIVNYLRRNHLIKLSVQGFFREVIYPNLLRIFFPSEFHKWKLKRFGQKKSLNDYAQGGYFNLTTEFWYYPAYAYLYPFRTILIWFSLLRSEFRRLPFKEFVYRLWDTFRIRLQRQDNPKAPDKSLRTVMKEIGLAAATLSEQSMTPLREGR